VLTTNNVSLYGIWLRQSNSDSRRPAPTLWSIFSFIDGVHASGLIVFVGWFYTCQYCHFTGSIGRIVEDFACIGDSGGCPIVLVSCMQTMSDSMSRVACVNACQLIVWWALLSVLMFWDITLSQNLVLSWLMRGWSPQWLLEASLMRVCWWVLHQ